MTTISFILDKAYQYYWKVRHDIFAYLIYSILAKHEFRNRTKYFGKVKVNFPLSLSPHAVLMYLDIYEYPVRHLLERVLRPSDKFLDIGANIGYFSAIALNLVGPKGEVHAFEPDPRYFKYLERLRRSNPKFNLKANQLAAGSRQSSARLMQTYTLGTSTLVKKLRKSQDVETSSLAKIVRLDKYLKKSGIDGVKLIKIDVEGFEFDVLKGLDGFLNTANTKPIIVVEIYPYAMKLQGYSLNELEKWVKKHKYRVEGNTRLKSLKTSRGDMFNVVFFPSKTT